MKTTLIRGNGRSLDTKRMHRIMVNLISVGNGFYVLSVNSNRKRHLLLAERKHTKMFELKKKNKIKKESEEKGKHGACQLFNILYLFVWPNRERWALVLVAALLSVLASTDQPEKANICKTNEIRATQKPNGRSISKWPDKMADISFHSEILRSICACKCWKAFRYDSAID